MSDHDRERLPHGGRNGGITNGDDRTGVELLRDAVERVAAGLPERQHRAWPARARATRTSWTGRWRALAAAAAVLVAAAGVAWMIAARGPAGSGARVAESELRIELFRVRGRAVPASVVAPRGADSLLVIPQVEAGKAPPAPRGPNGVALPGERS